MSDSIVTEYWLSQNFEPRSGITPGSDNLLALNCDQAKLRYKIDVTGITTTGNRLPSQDQIILDLAVGDTYQGGIVGYIDGTGQHGIIFEDQISIPLANWASTDIDISTSPAYGAGTANQVAILASHGSAAEAAYHCSTLTTGGYTDWVLPSYTDLVNLFDNVDAGLISISNEDRWTSTQASSTTAYAIRVNTISIKDKQIIIAILPIRYF